MNHLGSFEPGTPDAPSQSPAILWVAGARRFRALPSLSAERSTFFRPIAFAPLVRKSASPQVRKSASPQVRKSASPTSPQLRIARFSACSDRSKNTIVHSTKHTYDNDVPTSIQLPRAMLKEIDRRAKALKVSRSCVIVSVLENEFKRRTDWSASFQKLLSNVGSDGDAFAAELEAVGQTRRSKRHNEF